MTDSKKTPEDCRIVFDYNYRPLVTDTNSVLTYIASLVRQVKERAEQMGLDSVTQFVFKMSPELWEDISSLYACSVPDGITGVTPVEEVWARRAELRAKRSIFVDGMDYPVELDRKCKGDIYFMPEEEGRLRRLLTAILWKVKGNVDSEEAA